MPLRTRQHTWGESFFLLLSSGTCILREYQTQAGLLGLGVTDWGVSIACDLYRRQWGQTCERVRALDLLHFYTSL